MTFLAGALAFVFAGLTYPTSQLMRTIAEIGTTILLGYVIEAVWMTTRLDRETDEERENWLGSTAGLSVGGLTGVIVALMVSEHRAAGHGNFLDLFGFWWAVIALGFLGVLVALHPVIVDRWSRGN